MIRSARKLLTVASPLLLAVLLAAACGGDDDEATPTPAPSTPTPAATATPAATTPAGTPEPVTLEIISVSPSPATVGDTVTITFKTQPRILIGLQVTNPNGQIVIQTQLTAAADGTALLDQPVTIAGEWKVEAAGGRTLADLLALQINPKPGPHSAETTIVVQ